MHPHEYTDPAGNSDYHPPLNPASDGDDVEASCLSLTEVVLVARAVHQLWQAEHDTGTTDPLNDATNRL